MKKFILPLLILSFFISCREQDKITSSDQSDITKATKNDMRIISPQPGDEWRPGTTQIIRWNSPMGIESMQIQLYRKSELKRIISDRYTNSGSFTWLVPTDLVNSIHYRIRIVAVGRPEVSDTSEFFFIRSDKTIVLD